MNENLYQVLRSGFPADPDAPMIEVPADGGAPATVHTRADLEAAGARLATRLARAGAGRGERVLAVVEKSPEALFLYLACLRAGAVYLPVNPAHRRDELAYVLEDAEPAVVVCDPAREAEMRGLAAPGAGPAVFTLGADGQGSLTADLAGEAGAEDAAAVAGDDLAVLLYTSGTTGRPKGAMLSHRNLASNATTLHRAWGFRPGDVLLHALPMFHAHGLFVATHCALLNGGPILLLPRFEAATVARLLPRATVMMGVPTYYTRLMAEPGFTKEACANMRLFVTGSAPMLEETFHALEARTGHAPLERYGMTEAGMITSNPLEGPRVPGSVGPPLPGIEVRARGRDGRILGTDEIGVLEVRGENVFKGYWRKPAQTREVFTDDGYLVTGDLARIDERGAVTIVGRARDLIITGGDNVYPKEVELVLDSLPGVAESAVIGVPHPDYGEAVAAAVVPAPGGAEPSAEAVIAAAKDHLAGYKVPKRVFFLDALPRNTMGKVQKAALRARFAEAFAAQTENA